MILPRFAPAFLLFRPTSASARAADGGGSNGSRLRLCKVELEHFASELGIDIVVHHLPPGTSKWNKIEHWLFSFITMNSTTSKQNGRSLVESIIFG